jgi:hypothetical protein
MCLVEAGDQQSRLELGWVSAIDSDGRTIWNADAHRAGKRFVVRADEKLTAFLELEGSHTRIIPLLETQERRLA